MVDQRMSGSYTLLSSTMSQQSEAADESSVSGTIMTIYTDSEVDSSGSTTTHIGGDQHFGSPNPGDNTPNGSGRVPAGTRPTIVTLYEGTKLDRRHNSDIYIAGNQNFHIPDGAGSPWPIRKLYVI